MPSVDISTIVLGVASIILPGRGLLSSPGGIYVFAEALNPVWLALEHVLALAASAGEANGDAA